LETRDGVLHRVLIAQRNQSSHFPTSLRNDDLATPPHLVKVVSESVANLPYSRLHRVMLRGHVWSYHTGRTLVAQSAPHMSKSTGVGQMSHNEYLTRGGIELLKGDAQFEGTHAPYTEMGRMGTTVVRFVGTG